MATDNGGWTLVFSAPSAMIDTPPTAYTAGNARLMADALHVLLAFRSATQVVYTNYAWFDLPSAWRTQAPFSVAGTDLSTGVSINDAALTTATVRYGRSQFSTTCADPWVPTSDYGRICIEGTAAPFYSGFGVTGTDLCTDSTLAYSSAPCTADKLFSIAVR
jgi:hypothetical protein